MTFALRPCLSAGLLLLGLVSGNLLADESKPYSEAEKKLFLTDQLTSLPKTTVLKYRFAKTGSLEANFDDTVAEMVNAPDAGSKGRLVHVNFLSGDRKFELPDVPDAEGNPIVMFFLERDVREMHRITNGSANYYRKRIRMALEDEATVRPVTVSYGGKNVLASEIRVDPYRDDPARSRFVRYANKIYLITVSDQIPGGVYQLRTVMSDPNLLDGSKPMVEETLTLLENEK